MGPVDAAFLVVVGASSGVAAYEMLDEGVARLACAHLQAVADLARAGPSRKRIALQKSKGLRQQIVRDMPGFLDIVTLGLEAGLSFDASVELYCQRYQTTLASKLDSTMLLWRMGISSRGEALEELARDLGDPAMGRFASTVSEALAFGTPLSDALGRQAQIIRDEQRMQVEEEIERVPVKMLIPLGTLIVPAMLLSILGPLLGPALGVT